MNAATYRKFAILLAVLSLAGGSGVYWLWRFTRWPGLMGAGFLWLGAGLVLVGVGAFCAYRCGRPRTLPVVLLLLNFPLAALYTASAFEVEVGRIELRMSNDSGAPIRDIVLTAGQAGQWESPLPDLESGESRGVAVRSHPENQILIAWSSGNERHQQILMGYAMAGDRVRVIFLPDRVEIEDDGQPRLQWPILP